MCRNQRHIIHTFLRWYNKLAKWICQWVWRENPPQIHHSLAMAIFLFGALKFHLQNKGFIRFDAVLNLASEMMTMTIVIMCINPSCRWSSESELQTIVSQLVCHSDSTSDIVVSGHIFSVKYLHLFALQDKSGREFRVHKHQQIFKHFVNVCVVWIRRGIVGVSASAVPEKKN